MRIRTISALTMIALFFITLYLGGYAFLALCFAAETICLIEYLKLVDKNKPKYVKFIIILIGYILNIVALYDISLLLPVVPLALIGIFILNIFVQQYDLESCLYELFGIIYIPFMFTLAMVFTKVSGGMYLIFLAVGASVVTDTFAYFLGITFGKHKLCPKISPNKSIEGSIGGFVFAVLFSVLIGVMYTKLGIFDIPLIHYLLIGALISILSQYGDLTASLIKRKFGVKDYGDLIPGHGGVLDRADGILFALCGIFFYASAVLNLFL